MGSPEAASPVEPPSPTENSIRKRVCKACDRCRLKKSKCDGQSPCSRCRADNAICFFGERKKSHDKVYPKGYVEMLESQQAQLVAGLQELYTRLKKGQGWTGSSLKDTTSGYPLVHDILNSVGALKTDGSTTEQFEQDLPWALQKHVQEAAAVSSSKVEAFDVKVETESKRGFVERMHVSTRSPNNTNSYSQQSSLPQAPTTRGANPCYSTVTANNAILSMKNINSSSSSSSSPQQLSPTVFVDHQQNHLRHQQQQSSTELTPSVEYLNDMEVDFINEFQQQANWQEYCDNPSSLSSPLSSNFLSGGGSSSSFYPYSIPSSSQFEMAMSVINSKTLDPQWLSTAH